jgi:hypothetical protein
MVANMQQRELYAEFLSNLRSVGIPVTTAAKKLSVTTATIYNIHNGTRTPSADLHKCIVEFNRRLKQSNLHGSLFERAG